MEQPLSHKIKIYFDVWPRKHIAADIQKAKRKGTHLTNMNEETRVGATNPWHPSHVREHEHNLSKL